MLNPFRQRVPSALLEKLSGALTITYMGSTLMNDGQQVGLSRHQPALMIARPFDQAVDRSRHERVIQIEFGLDQIAFRRIQRSPSGEVFGDRIVDVLLTDGVFNEQQLDPLQILLGLDEPGLGLSNPAFRADIRRPEGKGIDLIQAVALPDVASLGKSGV